MVKFKNKQQYASDWTAVRVGLWHSKSLGLYWDGVRHYCSDSAAHNGIVGSGARLKKILKEANKGR